MNRDKMFMEMAINLAKKGVGHTSPNPIVGAIIVKNEKVIGEGFHEKYGGFHAERNAVLNATELVEGGTLYVTLEPCCHYGKTPPCTEIIIKSKIKKVVVGSLDPNPLVSGNGIEILKNSGIEVVTEFMKEECDELNKVFFHYIKNKMPYVAMKYAMSADGKISTPTGESQWITCEKSREIVHKQRGIYSSIMVGVGTVLKDNPMLDCRVDGMKNPIRIICDTNLRTPPDCKIVSTAKEIRTIIATCVENENFFENYVEKGCEVIKIPKKNNHVDLVFLMKVLGEMEIDSVYVEGGGTLNFSVLENKLANEILTFIGSKILGGKDSKTPVMGEGFSKLLDAVRLERKFVQVIENDVLISWEVVNCLQE